MGSLVLSLDLRGVDRIEGAQPVDTIIPEIHLMNCDDHVSCHDSYVILSRFMQMFWFSFLSFGQLDHQIGSSKTKSSALHAWIHQSRMRSARFLTHHHYTEPTACSSFPNLEVHTVHQITL